MRGELDTPKRTRGVGRMPEPYDYPLLAAELTREGLIVVDRSGVVQVYNARAREIFGMNPHPGPGHPAGRLAPRDVFILADNNLGADDGNLTPEDLGRIGVAPHGLAAGMAVVAIGQAGAPPGSARWQARQRDELVTSGEVLEVEGRLGPSLYAKALVDERERRLSVFAGTARYDFLYQLCAGHSVILDGDSLQVKFYQARGYTARGESLRDILCGGSFAAKGPGVSAPHLRGRHITQLHPEQHGLSRLLQVLSGDLSAVGDMEVAINGIPVRFSVHALRENEGIVGAAMVIQDVAEVPVPLPIRYQLGPGLMTTGPVSSRQPRSQSPFTVLVGGAPAFLTALNRAERAARSDATVLLLGETGTGKTACARAIHATSRRAGGPFLRINCAAIPHTLLEAELFGYEGGAFTGARREGKPGIFEAASGGTLFLDEVGELDPLLQVKLLHVLEEGAVLRVGATRLRPVDTRIIAATNRDPEAAVQQGEFRQDLYFRLNVLPIRLPALRERLEDLPLLASQLVREICRRMERPLCSVSSQAIDILMAYPWPGNIRELENVLEQVLSMTDTDVVLPEHLPSHVREQAAAPAATVIVRRPGELDHILADAERQALAAALDATGGNRTQASQLLGIGRTALYQKLRRHRLL